MPPCPAVFLCFPSLSVIHQRCQCRLSLYSLVCRLCLCVRFHLLLCCRLCPAFSSACSSIICSSLFVARFSISVSGSDASQPIVSATLAVCLGFLAATVPSGRLARPAACSVTLPLLSGRWFGYLHRPTRSAVSVVVVSIFVVVPAVIVCLAAATSPCPCLGHCSIRPFFSHFGCHPLQLLSGQFGRSDCCPFTPDTLAAIRSLRPLSPASSIVRPL